MSSDQPDAPTIQVAITGEEHQGEDRPEPGPEVLIAGRYRVERRIGKGGMGEVMLARDELVGREVAIKRMRAANPSERAIQRFLREASVQGRLEHPAICPVHEIGRDSDGLPFFVMKRLAGTSLAKILGDEFSLQRVLRAFADVCLAVELAHVRGIVHRDLKPDNIMLGDFGEVYVLDWGVAKVLGEEDGEFADVDSGSGEHATAAGTAIGTPGYMAPEQVRGAADIDGRADIYTLGCLLFEILAGEPLHPRGFQGLQSAVAGIDARPSMRTPKRDIAPELDALCVHATAADRNERIATARELGARVQQFLDGDRDLALRRELARQHLDRARVAFGAGEAEDARRTAMREAAGALALDPALDGAAELVGRLMLEPPRDTPREVEEALVADDLRTAKTIARAGLSATGLAIALVPFVWWIAPAGSPYIIAYSVVLALDALVAVHAARTARPRPAIVVVSNAIMLGFLARMYTPVLIAPGVAAALAMGMVLTPRFSRFNSALNVAAITIAAVLAPWVLEWLGVLSSTISIGAGGIVLSAPGVGDKQGPTIALAVIFVVGLIGGACALANSMRSRTRSAHRHLLVQAWQLRQLVPHGPGSGHPDSPLGSPVMFRG